MGREVPLRDETPGYVLLLEAAAETYARLDGSRQVRFHSQIEQFLCNATPAAALESPDKFPHPLRQVKDRNGNLRGLGVYCHGDGYDLLILQVVYDKNNENKYTTRAETFASRGQQYREQYHDVPAEDVAERLSEWQDDPDRCLFKSSEMC